MESTAERFVFLRSSHPSRDIAPVLDRRAWPAGRDLGLHLDVAEPSRHPRARAGDSICGSENEDCSAGGCWKSLRKAKVAGLEKADIDRTHERESRRRSWSPTLPGATTRT